MHTITDSSFLIARCFLVSICNDKSSLPLGDSSYPDCMLNIQIQKMLIIIQQLETAP